jgi:hypothetical protein
MAGGKLESTTQYPNGKILPLSAEYTHSEITFETKRLFACLRVQLAVGAEILTTTDQASARLELGLSG